MTEPPDPTSSCKCLNLHVDGQDLRSAYGAIRNMRFDLSNCLPRPESYLGAGGIKRCDKVSQSASAATALRIG